MDRFLLYEACVQAPRAQAEFLRAVHGGRPSSLREDFAGSAAVSRAWLALDPRARAVAVDLDAEALERASGSPRLERRCEDVMSRHAGERFDVVHAGNFSLGYFAERGHLLRYLALSRERLESGGILVADTFGGATAFEVGAHVRERFLADGRRVTCLWQRRSADPSSGRMHNTLSFRVDRDGEIECELPDAFEYSWRLWSLPELRDALLEAGFTRMECHAEIGARPPREATGAELGRDWSVCLVARR